LNIVACTLIALNCKIEFDFNLSELTVWVVMKTPRSLLFVLSLVAAIASTHTVLAQAAPVAPAAQLDFGNQSSETLTTKAWDALLKKNYTEVYAYTDRCLELYLAQAKEMQSGLSARAPADTASTFWALNDVGTCLYIRGQAFEAQGKMKEAVAAYSKLVNELSFAQTWDTKGWFWPPSEAAKQRIQVLEFEAL
jgi:tetratricopeptide (TPR) repeat protein